MQSTVLRRRRRTCEVLVRGRDQFFNPLLGGYSKVLLAPAAAYVETLYGNVTEVNSDFSTLD